MFGSLYKKNCRFKNQIAVLAFRIYYFKQCLSRFRSNIQGLFAFPYYILYWPHTYVNMFLNSLFRV